MISQYVSLSCLMESPKRHSAGQRGNHGCDAGSKIPSSGSAVEHKVELEMIPPQKDRKINSYKRKDIRLTLDNRTENITRAVSE
jgi:hypothetical protein